MKSAEAWINTLKLEPHPEGGYFRQTDQSAFEYHIDRKELPSDERQSIPFSSADI